MMQIETNHLGFKYYRSLPEGARPGNINDFHRYGNKIVGKTYYLYSDIQEVYFIKQVKEGTDGEHLKQFIDAGILFVHN